MIQDIWPKVFHNEYHPAAAKKEDPVFVFSGHEVLVKDPGDRQAVSLEDCPRAGMFGGEDLTYLFCIDDRNYYLYTGDREISEEKVRDQGYVYRSTRIFRRIIDREFSFSGMTAWHLYVWYRDHRHCGRCGAPTVRDGKERMLSCPVCGNKIYPVISPAVIVAVTDEDRILMTRYAGRPYTGNALIAGFCEIGETVEETVKREVMEEVGLKVKDISYYGSQPWGFAGNLLMGFFCRVDGSGQVNLDREELASAAWVSAGEIGREASELSLTADMIMTFKKEHTGEDLADRIRSLARDRDALSSVRKKESAVLVPLISSRESGRGEAGSYDILFEQRSEALKAQPGEICFPGGHIEGGETAEEAAIRETMEELLVDRNQIEILAPLSPVLGPGGSLIWPFAARIRDYRGTFSEGEVDHVFRVSADRLAAYEPDRHDVELISVPAADFPYDLIPGGKDYRWRKKRNPMYFYNTEGGVIWGVTGRILHDFLSLIRKNRD